MRRFFEPGEVRWRVVHRDWRKDWYTIERDRRLFRGRYRSIGGEEIARLGSWQYVDFVTFERWWWLP